MNRLWLILILITLTLGSCKAANQQDTSGNPEQKETAEQVSVDKGDYVPGTWVTNYDLALQLAKAKNLPVLANFTGSDWCSWCKKLSAEVFTQPAFQEYAKQNLILLKVDFPNYTKLPKAEQEVNNQLAEKFGIEGFPTIVLLDPTGKEIKRTGYQAGGAEAYVGHLQQLLQGFLATAD